MYGLYGVKYKHQYYLFKYKTSTIDNMSNALLNDILDMIHQNKYIKWKDKINNIVSKQLDINTFYNNYYMIKYILKINVDINRFGKVYPRILEYYFCSFNTLMNMEYMFIHKGFNKDDFNKIINKYNYIFVLDFDIDVYTVIINKIKHNISIINTNIYI